MAGRSTGTWFVYILRCADGTLYTGITKDLARRTEQHNAGAAIKRLTRRQKLAMIGTGKRRPG